MVRAAVAGFSNEGAFKKRRAPVASRTRAQSARVRGVSLEVVLKEPNVSVPFAKHGGGMGSGASASGR